MAGERGVSAPPRPTNVTFDTNCLIDLEEDGTNASHLHRIVEEAIAGRVNLRTVAVSASERKPDGTYAGNFSEFQAKLAGVGLEGFEILPPLSYWGVTFWGRSLWGGDQSVNRARSIHEVLFPESPFEYREYCEKLGVDLEAPGPDRKWRNRLCDTLALWTHLHFGGGVFVTSDGNFHKPSKRAALVNLGAKLIQRPADAADLCARR